MRITVGAGFASVVPPRFDPVIARGIRRAAEKLFAARIRNLSETIARVLPEKSRREDPHRIALDHYTMRLEDMWGRARGLGLRGWAPGN